MVAASSSIQQSLKSTILRYSVYQSTLWRRINKGNQSDSPTSRILQKDRKIRAAGLQLLLALGINMIPVGYMYKSVSEKPDWLKTDQVKDIYSVSSCVSEDFDDWVNYWKHNGYWFFDSPEIIGELAKENHFSLVGMKLFYYFAYEQQWDDEDQNWIHYESEKSISTHVVIPAKTNIEGYDVVNFSGQTSAECSPLSCNHMAQELKVNTHCLLQSFQEAKSLIESNAFDECEPGPYRIFEVHSVNA